MPPPPRFSSRSSSASFVRGAFLVLVSTGGYVWIRSPHKLRTAAATIAGTLIVMVASARLFPGVALEALAPGLLETLRSTSQQSQLPPPARVACS